MATLKKLTRMGADVRQIARLLQAKAPEGHMLAYITPEEAKLLKSQGGSGKEHEDTGVPSFQLEYDTGGYDTGGFEGLSSETVQAPPVANVQTTVQDRPFEGGAPIDLGYAPGTTPTNKPIDLGQAAPVSAPAPVSTPEAPYLPQGAFPAGAYAPPEGGAGRGYEPYQIDTTPPKTMGDKYRDLAKGLGVTEDQLGKLGIAGVSTLYNAYQSNKAQREAEAAKREQQGLAAPYQQKGAELQRAAQAGELTPEGQRQLQAVQAQAAQQASARGGAVGAAQTQAQIEALRSQLLQQQYDYGLKLSGIGDQIALGAIKTGLEADRYVQSLNSSFYTNMMYMLGGMQPPGQAQQRTT